MRQDLFLVARLPVGTVEGAFDWLVDDGPPFVRVDAVDFVDQDASPDIRQIFRLYQAAYAGLGNPLNVQMPEALVEYNRWVLLVDEASGVEAFACFKTTRVGLKLGLVARDGSERGKSRLKALLRRVFAVNGVYGEVSDAVENIVAGKVPEVPSKAVSGLLGKAVAVELDGKHYRRVITNVGEKRKMMVGRPWTRQR